MELQMFQHLNKAEISKVEKIREQYPEIPFPDVRLEPVSYGRRTRTAVPDKCAIVVDGVCTTIATDQYKLQPFELAVAEIDEMLVKLPELGTPVKNMKVFEGGGKFEMKLNFPEVKNLEIKKGDKVHPMLWHRGSYDTTWEWSLMWSLYQIICANGLMANGENIKNSKNAFVFNQKHRLNLDTSSIIENVKDNIEMLEDKVGLWQSWADTQLTERQFNEIWCDAPLGVLNEDKHDYSYKANTNRGKLLELPIKSITKGLTLERMIADDNINAWEVHNALTQFNSHEMSDVTKIEVGSKIESVFTKNMELNLLEMLRKEK